MNSRKPSLLGRIWRIFAGLIRLIGRLISLLFLAFFLIPLIVVFWMYMQEGREPEIQPDTVLVIPMNGRVSDGPGIDETTQLLLGEEIQTRQEIVRNIRKAAHDSRIIATLLKIDGFSANLTTTLEIREELLKFKDSGKPVFAYMTDAGMGIYLLASVADTIYMPPSGDIFIRGLRAEVPFYKEMFERIGVTPEFVAIGEYKTAPQIFTMDHLSDEYREVLEDLLDTYYSTYIQKVAESQDVPLAQVRTWIDGGLYAAQEALELGMIDELLYESQLEDRLQEVLGLKEEESIPEETDDALQEEDNVEETESVQPPADGSVASGNDTAEEPGLQTVMHSQYARVNIEAPGLHNTGEKIALVYASGTIVSGKGSPTSGQTIGADTMTELLKSLAEDEEIKGIILRIDSGGGSALASDRIRNSVQDATQKKPVIVSMADAAASGGYMIAAPADNIVAYPVTVTGSIGIFGGKFSLEGLADLVGVNIEIVQRGRNAGLFTSSQVHTEEEQERFRQFIQQGYDSFLANVAKGRQMTPDAVDEIAQGRIWMGMQAAELGLVDTLGGLETAITLIKEKLEIPEQDDVQLVSFPRQENPLEYFLQLFQGVFVATRLPDEILQVRTHLEALAQLQDEHLFAWAPYRIVLE